MEKGTSAAPMSSWSLAAQVQLRSPHSGGAVWDHVKIRPLLSASRGCKCLYYLMHLDCLSLCSREFQEMSEMSCRAEFLRNMNSLSDTCLQH